MADRIPGHVRVLVTDALEEAASGDWERARSLAEAVLALQPDNADARSIVQQANAARSPGERRQLTVVFSDVVGSTALAAVADPEVILDVLGTYHSACARVVNEHDGYIAQFLGDGVLAYFGYPRAHEDDARLAVQAGLEILAAVEEVAQTIRARYDLDLAVRVAVHTGLVVRAELIAAQYRNRDAIAGQTPNLAARLQDLARPGTLVISGATYQLVEGFFVCEPLGRLELRGIDDGVDAYQVTGRTLAETRLDAATQSTPFVGRDLEMGRLAAMWRKVQDGGSASLLIRGEPGVGKSRLALTFRNLVESAGGGAVSSACSTYQSETPLYPIVRLLMTVLGVDLRDDAGAAIEPLRTSLAAVGREDMLGAFADLLRLPRQGGWSSPEVDPQQLRQAVLDTLLQWVVVEAARAPTVIVIDDLQWADASTLELIDRVVRASVPGLLLVMTARDEFPPSWPDAETIELGRLPEPELRQLVSAFPEGKDLSDADVARIIARSEGVPLYLEELVRAGPSGSSRVATPSLLQSSFTVPPALLEPLLARLASPEVDLSLAQVMATIGQEADINLVAQVTGLPDATLRARLAGLIDARLIEANDSEQQTYRFRHQLLREVAYEMQLSAFRRRRHNAIADVLTHLDPPSVPVDAGALAHHLERADRIDEAIGAHLSAAGASVGQGGIAEAIAQFDHAVGLLDRVGNDQARLGLELTVRQARGMAWASLAGYASPGAAADLERCADLCRELGPAVDGVPGLMAAWYYCVIRGELDRAEDVILVDRRRLDPDPEAIPEEAAWSGIRFGRGQIGEAIQVMEAFLASSYAVTLGSTPAQWPLPDDPVVNTWSILGLARWMAADPTGAGVAFDQAAHRAARLDFPRGPFCRAYILLIRLLVYELSGQTDEALAAVDEMNAIAGRHGFALFHVCAALHAAVVAALQDPASGKGALEGAFEQFRSLGMDLWNPWGFTVLAEISLRADDVPGALRCTAQARQEAERTGARFWAAETCRVRGLARLASGDPDGRDDLVAAAQLAARQKARLFELRANLDLIRHGVDRRAVLGDMLDSLKSVAGLPELDAAGQMLEIEPAHE